MTGTGGVATKGLIDFCCTWSCILCSSLIKVFWSRGKAWSGQTLERGSAAALFEPVFFEGAAPLDKGVFLGLTLACSLRLDIREAVMDSAGLGEDLLPSFVCFLCTLFHGGT